MEKLTLLNVKPRSNIGHNKCRQLLIAIINREASRNITLHITREARSKRVDKANMTQRDASAAIDSGDDFSHQSTQAMDDYDNFDQTIMGLEVSQTEDPLSKLPSLECTTERPTRRLVLNVSLPYPVIKVLKL